MHVSVYCQETEFATYVFVKIFLTSFTKVEGVPLELEEQFSGILTYLIEEPFLFSGNGDLEGDQVVC